MRYYPIFMDLRGRRCIVVGGGRVAERKVQGLLRAGASVHVITPKVTPRLARLAGQKKIDLTPRPYRSDDIRGRTPAKRNAAGGVRPVLVFAATDGAETQKAVRRDAGEIGALVNAADDPHECDFIVPALFAEGDLLVAISTSGASPALAARLRRELERTLGGKYQAYLQFLRTTRRHIIETVPDEKKRAQILREFSGAAIMNWFWDGERQRPERDVKSLLAKTVGKK